MQLADTAAALEFAITETSARLVIIDPVSAHLGSTDSHRDAEVRGLMAPMAALAEGTAVAVLGIVHLAKQGQRPTIYRAVGSIAFAAAAGDWLMYDAPRGPSHLSSARHWFETNQPC